MIYISHLLPDREMKEFIESTGAGVESIEFSVADNLDALSEHITSYRKRLKFMGARHLILHGPFMDLNPMTYDRQILKVVRERYRQAYEAAVELNAEKLVFHTGHYPDAFLLTGWAERMADFYLSFLDECRGVEVVMENVFDRKWEPIRKTAELVDREHFRLCLDIGHANCYSDQPVTEWAENLKNYIAHVHIHDNDGRRDLHQALGDGTVPFRALADILSDREDITWTIECGSRDAVLRTLRTLRSEHRLLFPNAGS